MICLHRVSVAVRVTHCICSGSGASELLDLEHSYALCLGCRGWTQCFLNLDVHTDSPEFVFSTSELWAGVLPGEVPFVFLEFSLPAFQSENLGWGSHCNWVLGRF